MPNSTDTLQHPRLNESVITKFLHLHGTAGVKPAKDYLAKALGVSRSQKNAWARKILAAAGQPAGRATGDDLPKGETTSDTYDVQVHECKAKTLEEVVELCKVDTDKWEPRGFSVRGGKTGFGWNARFSKKVVPVTETSALDLFVAEAAKHAPKKWAFEPVKGKSRDCLYVLNLHDWHAGKLAHGQETGGADWDLKIAEKEYRSAVDDLMAKVPIDSVEEVIVIIGSDAIQVDNDSSTTTAKTYVDSDSRLFKIFDVAAKVMTDIIESLASKVKVRAVVLRGNHDETVSMFLGKYVEAWFRLHPNVIVDSSPKSRKYVGYGKVLIGFDHGDGAKPKDLPLLVMRENQSTISQYKFVEVLTGHFHTEQSQDRTGIVCRVAPALCSADRWHSKNGFQGAIRRGQGLLYHKMDGLQAIYYSRALD